MDTNQNSNMTFLKMNISDIQNIFISERKSQNLSINTIKYYQREVGYFATWLKTKGIEHVDTIQPAIIREYLSDLSTHRNKGGVHASYRAIKAYLYFYESEFEPDNWKNPIRKVKLQSNNIEPLEGISVEDVQKLIDACTGKFFIRNRAILHCLVSSGCRASEFLSINVQDVDIINGSVKIKHGKGDKSRYCFFGKDARRALRKYLAIHPANEYPLWLNDRNERLTISGLRRIVIISAAKAGVKHVGLHDFRRCFALSCYRKGVDILSISLMLGHSQVEVTKRYLNISMDDLRLAHEKGNPLD